MKEKLRFRMKRESSLFSVAVNPLIEQLPVVVFFVALFFSMIMLFGASFIMLVPIYTIMFKFNYLKQSSVPLLLRFSLGQFVISLLAYTASLNIGLMLLLNLVVIFYLVYRQSSQYQPLGYMISLMNFIFSQLLTNHHFLLKIQASLFGFAFFILGSLIYQFLFPKQVKRIRTLCKNFISVYID